MSLTHKDADTLLAIASALAHTPERHRARHLATEARRIAEVIRTYAPAEPIPTLEEIREEDPDFPETLMSARARVREQQTYGRTIVQTEAA